MPRQEFGTGSDRLVVDTDERYVLTANGRRITSGIEASAGDTAHLRAGLAGVGGVVPDSMEELWDDDTRRKLVIFDGYWLHVYALASPEDEEAAARIVDAINRTWPRTRPLVNLPPSESSEPVVAPTITPEMVKAARTQLAVTYGLVFFVAGVSLILGLALQMPVTVVAGLVLGVLGFLIRRKSTTALGIAMAILAVDALLNFFTSPSLWVGVGVRVAILLNMRTGFAAIRTLTQATGSSPQVAGTTLAPPTRAASAVVPPPAAPSRDDEFVRRCLTPSFGDEPESRTFDDAAAAQSLRDDAEVIAHSPDLDLAYTWLAAKRQEAGELDWARINLQRGLTRARRKSLLLTRAGDLESRAGNLTKAVYYWAQALHCRPLDAVDPTLYRSLAAVSAELGLAELQTALLNAAGRLTPGASRLEPDTADRLAALARSVNPAPLSRVLEALQYAYFTTHPAAPTPTPLAAPPTLAEPVTLSEPSVPPELPTPPAPPTEQGPIPEARILPLPTEPNQKEHDDEKGGDPAEHQTDGRGTARDLDEFDSKIDDFMATHHPASPIADLKEIVEVWMETAPPAEEPHDLARFMRDFEESWHVSSTKGSASQILHTLNTCMCNDAGGGRRDYMIYGFDHLYNLGEIRCEGIPEWWGDLGVRGSTLEIDVHGALHVLGKASDSEFLYLAHR